MRRGALHLAPADGDLARNARGAARKQGTN